MGKSKKHVVEVPEPINAVSGVVKKKGKRALEEVVENKSSKKQKKSEKIVAAKKKQLSINSAEVEEVPEVPPRKKGAPPLQTPARKGRSEQIIEEESSDEDEVTLPCEKTVKNDRKAAQSDTSDEDSELEEETKPVKPPPKTSAKPGAVSAVSKAKLQSAQGAGVKNGKGAESSSEDESSDSDEEPVKAPAKNTKDKAILSAASKAKSQPAKVAAVKDFKAAAKQESSSEDDLSDSDQDAGNQTFKQSAKAGAVLTASKAKLQPAKGVAVKNGKLGARQESTSEEDTSDSDEEPVPKVVKPSLKPALKKMEISEEDSSEDSDEDDSDESNAVLKSKKSSAVPKGKEVKIAGKPVVKPSAKTESSSDEISEDESDEDATVKKQEVEVKTSLQKNKTPAVKTPTKAADSDSDDDSDSGEELTQNLKQVATPARGSTDGGTKTVFVKNLAWGVDEDTVREFFQDAGEIHDIRLAMSPEGRPRGFGHIEYTSAEAAKKACEKTGQTLAGRDVFVDLAQERGSSGAKQDWKSPRGGGFSGSGNQRSSSDATAFVKGFDKFQDEDSIRGSLKDFFSDCGGVKNIRIPTDRETGDIKGFAYIDFDDKSILSKALEYNGSDIDGRYLTIEEAGPSSGGGRGRGGDFGGRGGRGGRGRGDFGDRGRGGRRGGRGGRGFGTPREKVNLSGSGKKTTFGED